MSDTIDQVAGRPEEGTLTRRELVVALSALVLVPPEARAQETSDWTFGGTWPYEPRWFESADGRMHYVDVGPADGTPVVLVHGNPTWGYLYRCFRNQLLLLNTYLVLTKQLSHDIQCQRCVSIKISCKYLDNWSLSSLRQHWMTEAPKKLGRGHEAREFLDPMKQALSGTMPRSLVDGHLDPTQARHLAEVIET